MFVPSLLFPRRQHPEKSRSMKTLAAILQSFVAMNPVLSVGGLAFTFAVGMFRFFNALWGQLLLRLVNVTLPPATAASVMSGFEFLNYVFPVSELFTFCTSFMTLYLVCAAIRMIKSFIPTIS